MDKLLQNERIVTGKKQTLRYLHKNLVRFVCISKDADSYVTGEIVDFCNKNNIDIIYYDNMKKLGKSCNIDVNAAAAAVLK